MKRGAGILVALLVGIAIPRAAQAAPAPGKVTPELIEAAKKEGKVVWYTAVDLPVAGAHRKRVATQLLNGSRCSWFPLSALHAAHDPDPIGACQ